MNTTIGRKWGAIVVGSGIGGKAAAAALSRVGKKVLLLRRAHFRG